jgi:predicted transcriptional regulator
MVSPEKDTSSSSLCTAITDLTQVIRLQAAVTKRQNSLLAQSNELNKKLLQAMESRNRTNDVRIIMERTRKDSDSNEPTPKRRRFSKFDAEMD